MSKAMSGKQAVPLEEVVLAQAFELEALLNVLERRGVIAKAEVLEEIKRLRARAPEAKERLALVRDRAAGIREIRRTGRTRLVCPKAPHVLD